LSNKRVRCIYWSANSLSNKLVRCI